MNGNVWYAVFCKLMFVKKNKHTTVKSNSSVTGKCCKLTTCVSIQWLSQKICLITKYELCEHKILKNTVK